KGSSAMPDEPQRQTAASTVISNRLSRLYRDHFGRGHNSVRTVIGHDHVVAFLEDIYTPLERTLVEAGETRAVEESRRAFQRAMREIFIGVVEEATGRTVKAFLSEVSLKP